MSDGDSEEAWSEKGYRAAQKIGYKLPAGITMTRGSAPSGVAFYFRHVELGELGRARIVDNPAGGGRLLGEVAGDQDDQLTATRAEMLGPLVRQLHHVLDETAGVPHRPGKGLTPPFNTSQESAGGLMVKLLQCETCESPVARLIFAPPQAHTIGDFKDVARRTFAICSQLQLPTWIVGPATEKDILTLGDPMNIRSTVMQIWPKHGPMFVSSPAEFNRTVDALQQTHCTPGAARG